MTHSELAKMAEQWLRIKMDCPMTAVGATLHSGENPDVIGFFDGGDSVVMECKTSKADFATDKYKPCRRFPENGMGDYRYLAVPVGVFKYGDRIYKNWGVIEFDDEGNFRIEAAPIKFEYSRKDLEIALLVSAMRRSNNPANNVRDSHT